MTAGTANQASGEKEAVQAGQRGTAGRRYKGRLSASQFMMTPKDQPRIAIAIIIENDYTYSLEYRRGYPLITMTRRMNYSRLCYFERAVKWRPRNPYDAAPEDSIFKTETTPRRRSPPLHVITSRRRTNLLISCWEIATSPYRALRNDRYGKSSGPKAVISSEARNPCDESLESSLYRMSTIHVREGLLLNGIASRRRSNLLVSYWEIATSPYRAPRNDRYGKSSRLKAVISSEARNP